MAPPLPPGGASDESPETIKPSSLYVGDLDPDVTDAELGLLFSAVTPVVSLRVCRCRFTGRSLCYGYVNFFSHSQAKKAFACLNHTKLRGKPIRIMWSQRDPVSRKSGVGNLFVKNLPLSISSARLHSIFCPFGTILSCKVADENGKSKGFGFVQFDSEKSAIAAQTALHGSVYEGKKLYVSKFIKKDLRAAASEEVRFTNLFVRNILDDMTEDSLKVMFSEYGKVSSASIIKDKWGRSKGFGFVNFQYADEANKALQALNGLQIGSKTLSVGRALKQSQSTEMLRTETLKNEYKQTFDCYSEMLNASKLHVKNLKRSVDDKRLQDIFSGFGGMKAAKIMRDDDGNSRGYGFVCFSNPDDAKAALNSLNGAVYEGRSLRLEIAQCKEKQSKASQSSHRQCSPVQFSYPSISNSSPSKVDPNYYSHFHYPHAFAMPYQPFPNHHFNEHVLVRYPLAAPNHLENIWQYSASYATAGVQPRVQMVGNYSRRKESSWKKGNEKGGSTTSASASDLWKRTSYAQSCSTRTHWEAGGQYWGYSLPTN